MNQSFPPMAWMIPGVIPEGLGILAGAPKAGKSWMALDLALSAAAGLPALGVLTDPKHVLYMALEDSYRRLQGRCKELLGNLDAPAGLEFSIDPTKALKDAGSFAERHPDGLLILDTIQVARKDQKISNSDANGADYRFARSLKDPAERYRTAARISPPVVGVQPNRDPARQAAPVCRCRTTAGIPADWAGPAMAPIAEENSPMIHW